MKIAIGNDHAGFLLKPDVIKHLESRGIEVIDLGHNDTSSCNYSVSAIKVGEAVAAGQVDGGILICGTGVGISIAANKVKGVRAACVSEPFSAALSKQHNNANILCFGSRVVGVGLATMIVDAWLDAQFEGGRHAIRVDSIMDIEK